MPGSGSAHLPFRSTFVCALFFVNVSFSVTSLQAFLISVLAFFQFSLLIRVGVAREQSVPTCHSHESVYSRDCCHSQLWRLGFQEKTSNWEGDPPGELTVPQTDTGEQVEYTRALERTMSKELGKMTP